MSDDRLLISPAALVGVLGVAAIGGWLWWQASLPEVATVARDAGVIPLGEPTRTGTPVLPGLGEVVDKGGCTRLLRLPAYSAISDKGLMDHAGFLDASPLLVLEDDQPLTPHSRGTACDGGFAHSPLGPVVRSVDGDAPHTWSLSLTSEVRAVRRRGKAGPQELLYIHPGTALEVVVPTGWQSNWGEAVVHLAGVATEAEAAATLSWGEQSVEVPAAGGAIRVTLELDDPEAGTVRITSPAGGPALVLSDLVVGTGEAATAVVGTSEGATAPIEVRTKAPEDSGPRPAVSRIGRPPAETLTLPDNPPDPCAFPVRAPELEELSDLRLYERYGYKEASPIRIFEDEAPMTPHARKGTCNQSFAHSPKALILRPGDPGPDGHTYTRTYDAAPESEVIVRGGATARIHWVYPGTSLSWTFPAPLRDGEHDVYIDVVSLGGTRPATVEQDDQTVSIEAAALDQRPRLTGRTATEPWNLLIRSPADGPVVLVRGFDARPTGQVATEAPATRADKPPVVQGLRGTVIPATVGDDGYILLGPKDTTATLGAHTDGDRSLVRLSVGKPEGGPRMCTPWVAATADLTAEAELRIPTLVRGDVPWKTARIEDAWRDEARKPVMLDGKPAMTTHLLEETQDWQVRTWTFPKPVGGVETRICVRLPFASGTVELAQVVLSGG